MLVCFIDVILAHTYIHVQNYVRFKMTLKVNVHPPSAFKYKTIIKVMFYGDWCCHGNTKFNAKAPTPSPPKPQSSHTPFDLPQTCHTLKKRITTFFTNPTSWIPHGALWTLYSVLISVIEIVDYITSRLILV